MAGPSNNHRHDSAAPVGQAPGLRRPPRPPAFYNSRRSAHPRNNRLRDPPTPHSPDRNRSRASLRTLTAAADNPLGHRGRRHLRATTVGTGERDHDLRDWLRFCNRCRARADRPAAGGDSLSRPESGERAHPPGCAACSECERGGQRVPRKFFRGGCTAQCHLVSQMLVALHELWGGQSWPQPPF